MPDNDRTLLREYRRKRAEEGTPEPFGARPGGTASKLRFVVHHHGATRTHFDLRLELDGVLKSWAVPKGPVPDHLEKRLAVQVEDHPLEYADFEGHIPDGNYGAGWTIVWDQGIWEPLADPQAGLESGKLLFRLNGFKLHGKWTLVRLKGEATNWLLIKEIDEFDQPGNPSDYPMGSVYSGLSIEQLEEGDDVDARMVAELKSTGLARKRSAVESVKPMLATAAKPFARTNWIFEIKYDGYRAIGVKSQRGTALLSRNGIDLGARFPELRRALASLPAQHVVLDGEIVVNDARGLPDFGLIQRRGHLSDSVAIAQASVALPATYYLFDLLAYDHFDLRSMPLVDRKGILDRVLPAAGFLRKSEHFEEDGVALFAAAKELGLEGLVAKDKESRYHSGRSRSWMKFRADRTDDFAICGYRYRGHPGQLRSLCLGQYRQNALVYRGSVGSGLDMDTIDGYLSAFERQPKVTAPMGAPAGDDYRWLSPKLVCEVKYTEITSAGQLRHPVFLRSRDDKTPRDCIVQDGPADVVITQSTRRSVGLTNVDKVFWRQEGYTKGDVIAYYRRIAPWMLPWLEDRPIVVTRYPDGIDGKSFFQKDAPAYVPEWIKRHQLWSESTQREISYFIIDSEDALVYLANMAVLPIHLYHSRLSNIGLPDWCVLDLDPKDAPFTDVATIAKAIHDLGNDIGLPTYLKTSGSTGLHVLLPLAGQLTFSQSRMLGELLATIIVAEHDDIATIVRNPARREGKVYIDYLQNGAGKLIAAPYCVRPKPGAPVSMPIGWHELSGTLTADRYTITNAQRRMGQLKTDPNLALFDDRPDMVRILAELLERVQ